MAARLLVNLFPINVSFSDLEIFVSKECPDPLGTIGPKAVGKEKGTGKLYWKLENFPNAESFRFNKDHFQAMKTVLMGLLQKELRKNNLVTRNDFIDGLTILEPTNESKHPDTLVYKEFQISAVGPKEQQLGQLNQWTIAVSFCGEKEVCTKAVKTYAHAADSISKVIVGKELKKYFETTDAEKLGAATFPVVGTRFRAKMGWPFNFYRVANKYARYWDEVNKFYTTYLKGKSVENLFGIYESGMLEINSGQIYHAKAESNLLVFGGGQTHFNTYTGLKEYGPYQTLKEESYKFFFIFHKADRDSANKLYGFLTKGLKGFPGIQGFSGLNLNLDRSKTITFENENPVAEIQTAINSFQFEPGKKYLAIYLSRVDRNDTDQDKLDYYYQIKKILLEKNVSSQVVNKDKIDNPAFNYFLPNICVAILAKLGGIPWRLSRPVTQDLVVGLGAFRKDGQTFLGTTVAFRNDGTFVRFDSSTVNSVPELVEFFKSILMVVAKDQTDLKRIVIHFYKNMNQKEEKAIQSALDTLGLSLPYVVLYIVTSDKLVPFDDGYSGRMPSSGTYVSVRPSEYLLCNNTRYSNQTGAKIDDFPMPVKISISKASFSTLSREDVASLIDQAYQFSRMYWVSVRQKGEPVTTLYSERVAKISSAFENHKLPTSDIAQGTLWFL